MERVYECIGQKANKPFYLEKLRCNIFSAEELIYCVYQHAELIEKEMFTPELVSWLERECGARTLAEKLNRLLGKKTPLTAFAEVLIQEMDLIENGHRRDFLEILSGSEDGNEVKRQKQRADYFLRKERYFFAMKEYAALLPKLEEQDIFLRAEIYHNMGIAKANLFLLEEAEKDFYEAYRLDGKDKHFYLYAAAMRMRLPSAQYIQAVSEIAHMKEVTLQLEEAVKAAEDNWKNGAGREFAEQKAARQMEGNGSYEKWLQELLTIKKEEYKRCAR